MAWPVALARQRSVPFGVRQRLGPLKGRVPVAGPRSGGVALPVQLWLAASSPQMRSCKAPTRPRSTELIVASISSASSLCKRVPDDAHLVGKHLVPRQ